MSKSYRKRNSKTRITSKTNIDSSTNNQTRIRNSYNRKRTKAYKRRKRRTITIIIAILLAVLLILLISKIVRNNRNELENVPVSSVTAVSETNKYNYNTATQSATVPTTSESVVPDNVKQTFITAGADDAYAANHPYCIAVNTSLNEVVVYSRAADGTYSQPFKAMVASCGKAESPTKTGTFKTVEKYTWRALNGGVFGQYATRIDGPYLFHSVPYYSQSPDSLETEEYNHLGENRSLGCVRLAVADCKWIYDNCPIGTIVTLYADSSVQEPLTKPTSKQIPSTGEKSGWDPTDPNPNNPWNS